MDIKVADQQIFLLDDVLSPEEAKERAWEKRVNAFDAMSKMASFLSRPREDDFELLYEEHRYQPFWHVVARSKYVYDRSANYQVQASSSEVQSITLQEKEYEVTKDHFHLAVIEYCTEEQEEDLYVDAVTGSADLELKAYLSNRAKLVKGELEKLVPKKSILVPPQARVSAIMRDALSKMIKGIQADKIIEEHVEVTHIDLYYRPVYAFQYRWLSKNKEAIVEVDGLTGEIKSGLRVFREYLGRVLDTNFLFDVGADAAGVFIPGGSIAVKVAKRYLDTKSKKNR